MANTTNGGALIDFPATLTTMFALPGGKVGTNTDIFVSVQSAGVTVKPLKVTVLPPSNDRNPVPEMVISVPTGAAEGVKPLIPKGAGVVVITLAEPQIGGVQALTFADPRASA